VPDLRFATGTTGVGVSTLTGPLGRVLYVWTALWGMVAAWGGGYSWHYFAQGADLLSDPGNQGGGLHVYAAHPDLQIGPLALLVAMPFQALGPQWGRLLVEVVLTLLGPVLLAVLAVARQALTGRRPTPALLICTGLLTLPIWCEVATHFAHLDDALAIAFTCVAALAVTVRRPWLAALAVGAAIDSKPWTLGFAVMLLALPSRQHWRSLAIVAACVGIGWAPFVIADPLTLAAGRFSIPNVADSALRALGVNAASTPAWDRPAQLALGVVVALVCVNAGRWAAVPLAVVAARLLLDPETYPYYSSGLLMCAAILDLLSPGRRMPVWTAAAAAWFLADRAGAAFLQPHQLGVLRALFCGAVLMTLSVQGYRARRTVPSSTIEDHTTIRAHARDLQAASAASGAVRHDGLRPSTPAAGRGEIRP